MGDLAQYIKITYECKGLPDKTVRHFLYQLGKRLLDTSHSFHFLLTSFFPSFLASALKFLRENNLVHRDIKPQVRK